MNFMFLMPIPIINPLKIRAKALRIRVFTKNFQIGFTEVIGIMACNARAVEI